MKTENRRELALKYIEKARKNIEKVYDVLYFEAEFDQIYEYYGSLDVTFDELKYDVEHMQLYEPEAEDPTDRETDEMILERLEKGE